jgi:hypothetical protein
MSSLFFIFVTAKRSCKREERREKREEELMARASRIVI